MFVGSSDRGLYALSAEDGSVLWRFETAGYVQCEPLYDPREDVVYFGSNDGALYKVTAKYGQLLWRFSTNAEVARRPVLSGGLLYVVNANDTLIAIEPRTGKMVWNQHRAPAMGMEVAGYAGPLVWRGKVYAGFSDGTVTAFDARTGAERWQPVDLSAEAEQTLGEVPQYLDVDTTPVADVIEAGAVVFVGSYAGGVFALDAESGTQIWSNPGVAGVSELVLWQQPAHRPRKGDGPERPERKLLARGHRHHRALGSRSGNRARSLAAQPPGRRRLGAGPGDGRAARVHHAARPLPAVADRRLDHRRHPPGRRLLGQSRRARTASVRRDQRRLFHEPERHAADLSSDRSPKMGPEGLGKLRKTRGGPSLLAGLNGRRLQLA